VSSTPSSAPIKFRLRYEPDASATRPNDSSMIEESEFTDVPGWMLLDLATRVMRHHHGLYGGKPSGTIFIRGIATFPTGATIQHRKSIHTSDLEKNQQALREMFLEVREHIRARLVRLDQLDAGQ
jgi:hypothetical protein